jgi:uncharacterized 2Fe-2S/4Fe-4S cluster protein (DUF4445 family)
VSDSRVTVSFLGEARAATVPAGGSLLRAAREAGVDIVATCGGRGRCRSCRIKVAVGVPPPPTLADLVQLGEDEVHEGYRLSCQYTLSDDATVQIAAPLTESAFQILVDTGSPRGDGRVKPDCGVEKFHKCPSPPADERQQTSDLDELLREVDLNAAKPVALETLRRVPGLLRGSPDGITIVTFDGAVMALEPGDTTEELYGIAFDIGTTTVVGYLVELRSGETLDTVSGLNPQTVYGGDVMSRIAFAAEDPDNRRKLRTRIVRFVNEQIELACSRAGVTRERIYRVVVVGNTCMHHLFLGIDPHHLGRAPYVPAMRGGYRCMAREVGLRVNSGAELFTLPLVAGFLGADTVAMILATRIYASSELRLAVDIGTNAEVVMGGRDQLIACSSPAGPAMEGGQIRNGMRAALGAIDRVRIGEDVSVRTVGDTAPIGICGSGLIDAVAALLDAGIVTPSGRLLGDPQLALPRAQQSRIRKDGEGIPEFVLVRSSESGNGQDILITQADIRQLQLAKAAILSGVVTLQQVMGIDDDGISELLVSGGFGNYLNIRNARRVGLIPDLPPSRVCYVANSAGLGAQLALLSETERERAATLAQQVTHVPLPSYPDFQQIFVDAIAFPAKIQEYQDE